jgi:hypothetical protein
MYSNSRILKVDDEEFERARELKCLGSTLTEGHNITTEIKHGILMANRASYGLKEQLSSRYLGSTKCALYKTPVRPTLTYGSESWPLKSRDENNIRIFERKTLRRIYGQIKENGI